MTDDSTEKENTMNTPVQNDPFLLPGLTPDEIAMFNAVSSAFAHPEKAKEYIAAMDRGELNIPTSAREWLEEAAGLSEE